MIPKVKARYVVGKETGQWIDCEPRVNMGLFGPQSVQQPLPLRGEALPCIRKIKHRAQKATVKISVNGLHFSGVNIYLPTIGGRANPELLGFEPLAELLR